VVVLILPDSPVTARHHFDVHLDVSCLYSRCNFYSHRSPSSINHGIHSCHWADSCYSVAHIYLLPASHLSAVLGLHHMCHIPAADRRLRHRQRWPRRALQDVLHNRLGWLETRSERNSSLHERLWCRSRRAGHAVLVRILRLLV
jgi:hypothetical protein